MNDFLVIPNYQRKKPIPKPIKDISLLPFNKGFETVVEPFLGDDDLRPVMMGVSFDREKKRIAATNTHILLRLQMPDLTYDVIESGIYKTKKQIEKDYLNITKKSPSFAKDVPFDKFISDRKNVVIEGKYPNYDAVIPEINTERGVLINVDLHKLYWFCKVLMDAKLLNEDVVKTLQNPNLYQEEKISYLDAEYFPLINKETNSAAFQYTDIGGKKQYIGFNVRLLADAIKSVLQMGSKRNVKLYFTEPSRATLVDFNGNGIDIALVMPVMIHYRNKNQDIEDGYFKNEFNEKTYQIAYDFDSNSILSKGELYPIDSSIGFEEVKSDAPKAKTIVTKEPTKPLTPEFIRKRIQALQISLKLLDKK